MTSVFNAVLRSDVGCGISSTYLGAGEVGHLVLKQAKRDGPSLGGAVVVPEGTHRRQDRTLETLRWATRVLVGVDRGVLTALEGIFSLAESFLGMALPEA